LNGFILIVTIVYLVGTGGTGTGTAAQVSSMQFADFRSCAAAADMTRRQIIASVPDGYPKPKVHGVCLPQSSTH
jgi:hypothetical protein